MYIYIFIFCFFSVPCCVLTEWTQEHFLLLFARIKSSIQDPDRTLAYSQSLKNIDWKEVAFSPFSAEACQQKWTDVMHKVRRISTRFDASHSQLTKKHVHS